MRRAYLAALVALALVLVGVQALHAQSIYGLSFRPTAAAPKDAPRGSADIVASDGDYLVSVDLSAAKSVLKLSGYTGAKAFVVWEVGMDGKSAPIGALDANLKLSDAKVDHLIAVLYVTAEPSADVTRASGDRLYEVTLRQVTEVSTASGTGAPAAAATSVAAPVTATELVAAGTVTATLAASPTASAPAPTSTPVESKPHNLPTTGGDLGDLLVLMAVALVLIGAGLKLRTVRL
jgi:hypothetical protein